MNKIEIKELSNKDLIIQWKKANIAYYNGEEPIMTDLDFNSIENELKSRGVDTDKLEISDYGESAKHPTQMLSLKKVNIKGCFNEGYHLEIIKWLQNSKSFNENSTLVLDFKMDGLAINTTYKNNKIDKAITRGDYIEGRDVTSKVLHLVELVEQERFQEIRYECVIGWDSFKNKYSDEYSHPRNLASGILNDININDKRKNDLLFAPLSAINKNGNYEKLIPFTAHLVLSYYDVMDFNTMKGAYDDMMEKRKHFTLPNDGLVLSCQYAKGDDHNGKYPHYALAIKFPPKGMETIVKSVEYNLKKSGEYFPKVIFEPITIDGRKIEKTHGFNHGFIINNKIGRGAKIKIDISGDIIPYLEKVIEPSIYTNKIPDNSYIDGIHLMCSDDRLIKTQKFIQGANYFNLKDFSESFYRDVADFYSYNPINIFDSRFTNLEMLVGYGISEIKAKKLLKRIKEKKTISCKDIILSMTITNCGDGTSEQLAKYYAKEILLLDSSVYDIDYDFARKQKDVISLFTENDRPLLWKVKKIDEELNNDDSLIEMEYAVKKQVFFTEAVNYLMTGSPKKFNFKTKAIFKDTLPMHYVEVKTMSKANLLICDDMSGKTAKMKKAREENIEIKTYGDLFE